MDNGSDNSYVHYIYNKEFNEFYLGKKFNNL